MNTKQTEAFNVLVRRVVERRQAFLKNKTGAKLYPATGTNWTPSPREQAFCEAFIVLFVAELETYIEAIVGRALNAHMAGFQSSYFSQARPGAKYYEAIKLEQENWKKNNNTNWSRIGQFFEFIGLKSTKFPPDLWDSIEIIAKERGGIVHKGLGARVVTDPRSIIGNIEKVLRLLKIFDRDAFIWLSGLDEEVNRLNSQHLEFLPGSGTIGAPL